MHGVGIAPLYKHPSRERTQRMKLKRILTLMSVSQHYQWTWNVPSSVETHNFCLNISTRSLWRKLNDKNVWYRQAVIRITFTIYLKCTPERVFDLTRSSNLPLKICQPKMIYRQDTLSTIPYWALRFDGFEMELLTMFRSIHSLGKEQQKRSLCEMYRRSPPHRHQQKVVPKS